MLRQQILEIYKIKKPTQYFYVCVLVGLVAAGCYALSGLIGYKVIAYLLLVTVSLLAMFFDIAPVLLAALLSALAWDYFFIPPRYTFHVSSTEDGLMLLMYFIIALVNAVLTYKIRKMEKEVRRKEEKANVVKLYNTLLNSLSHELKTPIATIIGAADNLLTDAAIISEENKQKLTVEIATAATRLHQQVENLLNMSRLESGYIQPKKDWSDVNELIYGVVNRLEERLTTHQLKIEISEQLPLFKIDMGLLEQVLHNLVNNAIIYTPADSRITISAYCATRMSGHFTANDVNELQSTIDTERHSLVMVVADNGQGFPLDEMDRVFDKFYRLKNAQAGGTGLGLSIVKGFVQAHGGSIHLSNIPSGGAMFTIEIPAETSYLNNLKNE